MRRTFAVLACVAALAACDSAPEPLTPRSPSGPATGSQTGLIPGRYIVTLSDDADPRSVALQYGIQPTHVYETVLTGFAGEISEVALQALRLDGRVQRIEQDGIIVATTTQSPVTWGLDRIDQQALPLNGSYTYNHDGSGVTAYIIDTGIRYDHAEFGGRASFGIDMMPDSATQQGSDCHGHGTHVAGTVGGTTYGVAKDVDLVAVRVLGCNGSGSFSGIIGGMDWVADNASLPAVANMSIGSLLPQRSSTVDQATSNLIAAGVTVVLAAGNGIPNGGVGIDACSGAPGGHPLAITVGATDKTDTKTVWSNYGSCVTLFAPGSSIVSAGYSSSTASATMSGTSMASPHVAGVAALYLQQDTAATPATVKAALSNGASQGVVKNSLSVNNHLVYSLVTP
ncbi:MAG TPA: S8 family serine peptidase [Longimicrobiaceae bacterium]|nr:S8 family serine peptidase [Longimicrobiaceae bacterium]